MLWLVSRQPDSHLPAGRHGREGQVVTNPAYRQADISPARTGKNPLLWMNKKKKTSFVCLALVIN